MIYWGQDSYVSFEIAKLIGKLDVEFNIHTFYNSYGEFEEHIYSTKINKLYEYYAPTHQLALKWLRENYNILIYIDFNGDINHYCWAITDLSNGNPRPYDGLAMTYEEAADNAIKYCLENLI